MTASEMENMSLIMEEEIVHFISQIKDDTGSGAPSRETNNKCVEDRGIQYDPLDEMSSIIKNDVMQASIDQAEILKSCTEDHHISGNNISKIRIPLHYKTMNHCHLKHLSFLKDGTKSLFLLSPVHSHIDGGPTLHCFLSARNY